MIRRHHGEAAAIEAAFIAEQIEQQRRESAELRRGLAFGLPISALLWAALGFAIWGAL